LEVIKFWKGNFTTSHEIADEKLRNWKNLTVRLRLYRRYENQVLQKRIEQYAKTKGIRAEYVDQSLKRISRNALISERSRWNDLLGQSGGDIW
jgi:hypothetical protein